MVKNWRELEDFNGNGSLPCQITRIMGKIGVLRKDEDNLRKMDIIALIIFKALELHF